MVVVKEGDVADEEAKEGDVADEDAKEGDVADEDAKEEAVEEEIEKQEAEDLTSVPTVVTESGAEGIAAVEVDEPPKENDPAPTDPNEDIARQFIDSVANQDDEDQENAAESKTGEDSGEEEKGSSKWGVDEYLFNI